MNRRMVMELVGMLVGLSTLGAGAATGAVLSSESDSVRWSGGPVSGPVPAPEACVAGGCHEFLLVVSLPAGVWSQPGGLQVGIRWAGVHDDLDLYVYGPDGSPAASSAGLSSSAESVLIPGAANGSYRVLVAPATGTGVHFDGVAEVERPPAASPARDLLPDLVSLPQRNVVIGTSAYFFEMPVPSIPSGCYPEETLEQSARRCLRFDQVIANAGAGPLELRYSAEGVAQEETRRIRQRIHRSDGAWRERNSDTYVFHPTHAHFHYRGFAQSHLWRATPAGDRLGEEPIRSGRKNGFCVFDGENIWFGRRGDGARTFDPARCLAPSTVDPDAATVRSVHGISAGWADVYTWHVPGQFIEISGVPDGWYLLETVADPDDTIQESSQANNAGTVLIRLCGEKVEQDGGPPVCS